MNSEYYLPLPGQHGSKMAGSGIVFGSRSYPKIEKCPFCEKTDIERKSKNQKTCGGYGCQQSQRKEAVERRKSAV